jgi:hypothetical protein
LPAPESPFVNLLLLSAPYVSSVSEQLHPLHIVLKGRDYGFIGLKLKDLIFHRGIGERTGGVNITGLGKKILKENVGWRLAGRKYKCRDHNR